MKKLEDKILFPVSYLVHTPSGAIEACERHKNAMINIYGALGCHIGVQQIKSNNECINCVNENKIKP
jgi:hypothetical protein